jgi:hypothetical protein
METFTRVVIDKHVKSARLRERGIVRAGRVGYNEREFKHILHYNTDSCIDIRYEWLLKYY